VVWVEASFKMIGAFGEGDSAVIIGGERGGGRGLYDRWKGRRK